MKKYILLAAVLLSGIFLTACGGEKEETDGESAWMGVEPGADDLTDITERTEYYDLSVETEELFDPGLWEQNPQDQVIETAVVMGSTCYVPVGVQFYQGEPVQLWATVSTKGTEIYLYREDGERELLLQNIPSSYFSVSRMGSKAHRWYLDQAGDFYCYYTNHTSGTEYAPQGVLMKVQSNGKILYETKLKAGTDIDGLQQTADGEIWLLLQETGEQRRFLARMDPDSGEVLADSRIEIPYDADVYLGNAAEGPAVTGYSLEDLGSRDLGNKIMKVDRADGSLSPILFFTGTSYGWPEDRKLQDFRVLEDGRVEMLWTNYTGFDCRWERMRMEKVEKIPIVVRGVFTHSWFAERIAMFNAENGTYHVIVEDCGLGNDLEEFARLTSVQVGAGKGPDILNGYVLNDSIVGMLEKGALEELNPYMEMSGIREEDYFPAVFSTWRQGEKIYGVNFQMCIWGQQMEGEVLGGRQVTDIESLVDALLAWEEDRIYRAGLSSGDVLNLLLQGSDSLWGMVDWESGSCDFNTPLFEKLLKAARRYGDDGRRGGDEGIMEDTRFDSLLGFEGKAQQEKSGKVTSGVLFDDGCYAVSYPWYCLAINANSEHKEGAWEFLAFLIGEECQGKAFNRSIPPVRRDLFESWMQEEVAFRTAERADAERRNVPIPVYDVSQERQEEYRKAIEEARPLPIRTKPILMVVCEEAEYYFYGAKSVEEIADAINKRVQLYLDERK